jgi:quercetin dioxygenase-like cupin family protein
MRTGSSAAQLKKPRNDLFPNIARTTNNIRKAITMKQIRTTRSIGQWRFTYALSVCAFIITLGMGSAIAADEGPKVTVVFDHAIPNVPGKSMKGILVEYGPGVASVGHTHPKSAFIYATVLEGAIRTSVNDGPPVVYRAGQNFPEFPGDRHTLDENASKTETGQAAGRVRGQFRREGAVNADQKMTMNATAAVVLVHSRPSNARVYQGLANFGG